MAGVGVGQHARRVVVEAEVESGVLFRRGAGIDLPVEQRHHLRRRFRAGARQVRAHRRLDCRHQQRRRNPLAGHVADR